VDVGGLWQATREELGGAYRDLVNLGIDAVQAAVVVALVVGIGRIVRRRVERGLGRVAIDRNVATLAANGVTVASYVVAVTLVLAVLGASWTALGALLGAGTVAISLALQDVLRSFVAGVYLLVERPFAIGDRIRVRDVEGSVEAINLRTTAIRTDAEERVLLPNATVFGEIVTNRSTAESERTVVTLKGLTASPADLPAAVAEALAGLAAVPGRQPLVEIVAIDEGGLEAAVEVPHPPGARIGGDAVMRLRDRFPEAAVAVGRG